MPEAPERDLEKQLRQHAEERRAAAGEPSLHPADRRLLQAEVRRHWGDGSGRSPEVNWLARYWPRLAMTLGLLIVLATAAVFMTGPGTSKPTTLAKLKTDSAPAASVPLAAPAATAAPARAGDDERPRLKEGDTFGVMAESFARANAETVGGVAGTASPTGTFAASREVLGVEVLAAKTIAPPTQNAFFASSSLAKDTDAYRWADRRGAIGGGAGGAMMDAVTKRELEGVDVKVNAVTQVFRNVSVPAEDKSKSSTVLPVLANFTVAQKGNELTVVDEDGSVYNGTAELAPPEIADSQASLGRNRVENQPSTRMALRTDEARRDQPATIPVISNIAVFGVETNLAVVEGEVQNWQFKVEGTNRSLRQRVVFTGNLIQNNQYYGNQAAGNRQAYQQQNPAQNVMFNYSNNQGQLAPQNNFINGRVVLDNRKEAEVNALSVDPK